MQSPPTRLGRRIAAAGHLAGFLSASFLIHRMGRAAGIAAWAASSPVDGVARMPLPFNPPTAPPLPLPFTLPPEGAAAWFIELLQGAILPAAIEEFFFRGLVFEIVRRVKGETAAIGVSAVLFGLAHPGLAHTAAASLLGLYLGALRARWGLALPLVAHALNNGLAVFMRAPQTMSDPAIEPTDPWLWLALGLLCSSVAMLRQEMRNTAPATTTAVRRILQRNPAQDETGR